MPHITQIILIQPTSVYLLTYSDAFLELIEVEIVLRVPVDEVAVEKLSLCHTTHVVQDLS